jgi:hypothetical protein
MFGPFFLGVGVGLLEPMQPPELIPDDALTDDAGQVLLDDSSNILEDQ